MHCKLLYHDAIEASCLHHIASYYATDKGIIVRNDALSRCMPVGPTEVWYCTIEGARYSSTTCDEE